MVHDGKLFLVSQNEAANSPDPMRVYDFGKQDWVFLELTASPPAGCNVLLDVYEDQLIQFGGTQVCPSLAWSRVLSPCYPFTTRLSECLSGCIWSQADRLHAMPCLFPAHDSKPDPQGHAG